MDRRDRPSSAMLFTSVIIQTTPNMSSNFYNQRKSTENPEKLMKLEMKTLISRKICGFVI